MDITGNIEIQEKIVTDKGDSRHEQKKERYGHWNFGEQERITIRLKQ